MVTILTIGRSERKVKLSIESEVVGELVLKDIDILLFDFHLDLRPVLSPARLKAGFTFLSDPIKYQAQQSVARSFTAGGLELHPLSPRSRKRNRFWTRYCSVFSTSATPDWDIQVPFTIRPNVDVSLPFNAGTTTAKVRPSVEVNSIGWSTNLEVAISGSISVSDLQGLTQRLLDKRQKPFTIAGSPASLPGVMKHFGTLWQSNAYSNPTQPPRDTNPIERHIIVSIGCYQGGAKPYRHELGGTNWMTGSECAQLHGILLGRPFAISELPALGSDQGYTYTQFGDPEDFAISYFNHGSLIFMQKEAVENGKRRKSMGCLARNLSHFSLLAVGLPNVLRYTTQGQLMQELKATLQSSLKSLGDTYTNEFCQMWFRKHNFLKQL